MATEVRQLIESLRQQADALAAALPDEAGPALLRYHARLLMVLNANLFAIEQQTESVRRLRGEMQPLIYDAIAAYGAAQETDRAALRREIEALATEQQMMRRMLGAIALQLGVAPELIAAAEE